MCALVTGVQTCALPIWWRLSVKNGGEAKDLMLDFEAACDAHIRWRVRFRSAINAQETLDARRISEDHHCEVGIWLQGAGHRRFADHPVSLLAWRNMLHFTLQPVLLPIDRKSTRLNSSH